ncbi:MAG: ATP phosphoribosyltransferase regulatory subunit, partial [Bauldia sp.]
MTESFESLRRLFSDAGYAFVEPAIVQPASVFVELAGEDLRRRLFLTSAADGTELALRPDYTIPVCLHHLATGPAKRRANYAYLGPVFRQRRDQPGEFLQAGIESLGNGERIAADAETLRLAFAAAALLGVKRPSVRIGDSAIFGAALAGLDLDAPWRKRLARTFGETERLTRLIARANGAAAPPATRSRSTIKREVAERLAATGLGTVGGRSADEIADRAMEKAALAAGIGARASKVLSEVLAVGGTPAQSLKALGALARREKLDMATALDRFQRRIEAFVARGIDVDRLTFAADFGRRLDYYTGFVFEFHLPANRAVGPIVGGGRYDRLMALMPDARGTVSGETVPAVGFAMWLERFGAAGPPAGGRAPAKRASNAASSFTTAST